MCEQCWGMLNSDHKDRSVLIHPGYDGNALFGKRKKLNCPHVGKRFKNPLYFELKELGNEQY